MKRYHKKIYFPINNQERLSAFCDNLNNKQWQFTKHTLDNLKYRNIDKTGLLLYIKERQLRVGNIFEYYEENNIIIKACFRLAYNEIFDIILVINNVKSIITIYLNLKEDRHYTLNESIYNRERKIKNEI